jgi:ring-1,2-phenylacetyl-CoA epoxidase subunit PaaC
VTKPADTIDLFEFLLRMGDNTLILGHRLSEWCGKAPILEEDIALANTALDLIGQTQLWLGLAAEVEGKGRTADDLAMLRDVWDFRCALLVQQPNGDFGHTIMRQFLFDAYQLALLEMLATGDGGTEHRSRPSSDQRIRDIASKAVKEVTYHLERSADLVVRLGDGTQESHTRMQAALDTLWPFAGELLTTDPVDIAMADAGVIADPGGLRPRWLHTVTTTLNQATLTIPTSDFAHKGGKSGQRHTEHLGHLLTQMQWLQRAYPDAQW